MLFHSKIKYLNVCLTVTKFVRVSFCRSTKIQVKTVFNMSNHFAVICFKMEFTFLEHWRVHRALWKSFQWCVLFVIFRIISYFKISYVENLGSQIQRLKSSDDWKWIGTHFIYIRFYLTRLFSSKINLTKDLLNWIFTYMEICFSRSKALIIYPVSAPNPQTNGNGLF